ncbi:hypothetical protein B6U98_02160 [Thermoplasmatales archaeon ex4572_165]|nr:MAG: hypothetical protein B6U98_02160 [Thermoplasmatales archaeon ex4572_165]
MIKKVLSILCVLSFLNINMSVIESDSISFGVTDNQNQTNKTQLKTEKFLISDIEIIDSGDYVYIDIKSDSYISEPGKPLLPLISKEFSFPLGTKILDVNVNCEYVEHILSKKILPSPKPSIISNEFVQNNKLLNESIYNSPSVYPSEPFSFSRGAGLKNNKHVLFLNVNIAPLCYPIENTIKIPKTIEIIIEYQLPTDSIFTADEYDMVIITSEIFSSSIQPLIDHKNAYGIQSFLKTTEEIFNEYEGRDDTEKIKYFIKNSIEEFGIKYVMLIGNDQIVPMRKCANTVITGVINWHYILSDLYYADIYDNKGEFSSWDTNQNEKYGECYYDYRSYPIDMEIIDIVDFYPDVGIGRLPCSSINECNIIVDKIIQYEKQTYHENWFNTILLLGGDTFPDNLSLYEGEWFHEQYTAPTMKQQGFTIEKLFTSKSTFSPTIINENINNGAGFLNYVGHGYTDSIGTSSPHGIEHMSYSLSDINALSNDYRLPICFFDACLTGKIDYDILDKLMLPLISLYPTPFMHFMKRILDSIETQRHFPCFSGSFITKQSGGCIAAVAATQPGLVGFAIDDEEIIDIVFGSSILNRFFFESYEPGIILSDMFIESQNLYINFIRNLDSMIVDCVTLQEFNLFGDPSLKVGGYP